MRHHSRTFAAFAVLATAALGSACSGPNHASAKPSTNVAGDVSEARSFQSLQDLSERSGVVVVARATDDESIQSADAAGQSGDKATVTKMTIVKSYKGGLRAGDTISLRQMGTRAEAPQEIVNAGDKYLLYLNDFRFADGKDTGQWVASSISGTYKEKKAGTFAQIANASEASPNLPHEASEDLVEKQIK